MCLYTVAALLFMVRMCVCVLLPLGAPLSSILCLYIVAFWLLWCQFIVVLFLPVGSYIMSISVSNVFVESILPRTIIGLSVYIYTIRVFAQLRALFMLCQAPQTAINLQAITNQYYYIHILPWFYCILCFPFSAIQAIWALLTFTDSTMRQSLTGNDSAM